MFQQFIIIIGINYCIEQFIIILTGINNFIIHLLENMFILHIDTNMAFKHISLLWSTKDVIMGHMGFMAFCPNKKPISPHHVGDTAFFAWAKNPYHHIQSIQQSCL